MGILLCEFNPRVFKSVPEFGAALKKAEDSKATSSTVIQELGKIFLKHKVHDQFGLTIVHQHFDLDPKSEILVESVNKGLTHTYSMPWVKVKSNDDGSFARQLFAPAHPNDWKSFGLSPEKPFILPQTWVFPRASEAELENPSPNPPSFIGMEPIEFFESSENGPDNASDLLHLHPPASFVNELFVELKKRGLEHIFGVRRTWYNKLGVKGSSMLDVVGVEHTPPGLRANVVELTRGEQNYNHNEDDDGSVHNNDNEGDSRVVMVRVPVTWSFNMDGQGIIQQTCVGVCMYCSTYRAHMLVHQWRPDN